MTNIKIQIIKVKHPKLVKKHIKYNVKYTRKIKEKRKSNKI